MGGDSLVTTDDRAGAAGKGREGVRCRACRRETYLPSSQRGSASGTASSGDTTRQSQSGLAHRESKVQPATFSRGL